MFRFALMGAVGALSAMGAAKAVVSLEPASPVAAVAALRPSETPEPTAPASVSRAADGHYWAEGDVNGRQVRFLVDTGATAVSLTGEDARRLGLDTAQLSYDRDVLTAEGRTRAASVRLEKVAVAGAVVHDVEALVIEKGLSTSLLGMTYLGRLSRIEATPQSLILRP